MKDRSKEIAFSILSTGAAIGAGYLARKLAVKVWARVTGEDAPGDPASPDTAWRHALIWSATAGLVAGLTRMLGQRGAERAYERLAHERPPQYRH